MLKIDKKYSLFPSCDRAGPSGRQGPAAPSSMADEGRAGRHVASLTDHKSLLKGGMALANTCGAITVMLIIPLTRIDAVS